MVNCVTKEVAMSERIYCLSTEVKVQGGPTGVEIGKTVLPEDFASRKARHMLVRLYTSVCGLQDIYISV